MAFPPLITTTTKALQTYLEHLGHSLNKLNQLNSYRRKRFQRRQAICVLATYFLEYMDIITLKVGFHDRFGNFVNYGNLNFISKKTGLTLTRLRRALRDLAKAGYIFLEQICYKTREGLIKTVDYIKTFTHKFFYDLGMKHSDIVSQQHYMRKRAEMQPQRYAKSIPQAIADTLFPVTPSVKRTRFISQPKVVPMLTEQEKASLTSRGPIKSKLTADQNKYICDHALELFKNKPPDDPRSITEIAKRIREDFLHEASLLAQAA